MPSTKFFDRPLRWKRRYFQNPRWRHHRKGLAYATNSLGSIGDHGQELLIIVKPRRQVNLTVERVVLLYARARGYSPVGHTDDPFREGYSQYIGFVSILEIREIRVSLDVSANGCQVILSRRRVSALLPALLESDWRSEETEFLAQPVFDVALVREVQLCPVTPR